MKTEEERPNAMPPWGLTVGAIFAHFSFVISDPKDNFWLTIMFGVSMVSLSLWAINDWKNTSKISCRRRSNQARRVNKSWMINLRSAPKT
tara:strand:- start:130 stop:399 length:270 start_codon:yes stop_codon:yes gene_type:complete